MLALRQACWTSWAEWNGRSVEVRDAAPGPCRSCLERGSESEWAEFGCGYRDETRGKARFPYAMFSGAAKVAPESEEARTCPWYYVSQGFVQDAFDLAPEFKAGRLGPIWQMAAPLVDLLRVTLSEFDAWQRTNDERVHEQIKRHG